MPTVNINVALRNSSPVPAGTVVSKIRVQMLKAGLVVDTKDVPPATPPASVVATFLNVNPDTYASRAVSLDGGGAEMPGTAVNGDAFVVQPDIQVPVPLSIAIG